MERVTGIGGIFFRAKDQKKLSEWHEKHLGLKPAPGGEAVTRLWREHDNPARAETTVWSNPSRAPFMINYRVDDPDALLQALRAEGVEIDPKRENHQYGRFAWIMDPEGNRIEL